MTNRQEWDQYFMDIALLAAARSTCDRALVGAVIVKDNQILATGYNGAPSKFAHCDDVGHLLQGDHCVRSVHAEQNAICSAARRGISIDDSILYVTHFPCVMCLKMCVSAGIRQIVYRNYYRNEDAIDFVQEANKAGVLSVRSV